MNLSKHLFLSAVAVLGFAACSSDDDASSADAGAATGGTPTGGTPVGGTPEGGSGGAPVGGTPVGGTPVGGTPTGGAGGEPVGGAGGAPVGGAPANVCPEPIGAGGAGGEAAGGAGGEAGTGGTPAVDPAKAARCETQCGRLADCATAADPDLCPCYDPSERDALYQGCYNTCLGPVGDTVLAIAEGPTAAACDGLVRIISGVNPDFKVGCVGSPPM